MYIQVFDPAEKEANTVGHGLVVYYLVCRKTRRSGCNILPDDKIIHDEDGSKQKDKYGPNSADNLPTQKNTSSKQCNI